MDFLSAFGPKVRVHPDLGGKSLTKQSMAAECNINNIVKKYQKTGAVTHVSDHGASYDFCSGESFHEALLIVGKAKEMFDDLPSTLRERFAHEPARFLDFVQDPANAGELVELGLAEAGPTPLVPAGSPPVVPPAEPSEPAEVAVAPPEAP